MSPPTTFSQVPSLFQLQAEHRGRLRRCRHVGGHHDLHLLRPDGGQSHPQVDPLKEICIGLRRVPPSVPNSGINGPNVEIISK